MITGGTASKGGIFAGFPYVIAGKSGTAERFSRTSDAYDTNKSSAHLAARHRAWFEAYTPAADAKIAAAAMLESGAWGAADGGPIVRKIFDAWLVTQGKSVPLDTSMPEQSLPVSDSSVDQDTEDMPVESSSSEGGP